MQKWAEDWKAQGVDKDIEYMVETAPALETRRLSRRVMADLAIVQAACFFSKTSQ